MIREIEIVQDGIGVLELYAEIPASLQAFGLGASRSFYMKGDGLDAVFQEFSGNGFLVWFSRYWAQRPLVLRARSALPTLELRICWKNSISGTWDKILSSTLPEYYYQFSFVPFMLTRAEFEAGKDYQTFDIHFDLAFFERIGVDYKLFQQFLGSVVKDQPAELYPQHRRCPAQMIDAVQSILSNRYSATGKKLLLENNVCNILLSVLEDVDPEGKIVFNLSVDQLRKIYLARDIITDRFPKHIGTPELCRRVQLNLTYLTIGFRQVFGVNPLAFYNLMRMDRAKQLLREGNTVIATAMELEYETDRSLSKAFKARFGMSPKEYQRKV